MFLYRPNYCATSVNDRVTSAETLLECMQRCLQELDFNCNSLDFQAGDQPMCYLRHERRDAVASDYVRTDYCYSMDLWRDGMRYSIVLRVLQLIS